MSNIDNISNAEEIIPSNDSQPNEIKQDVLVLSIDCENLPTAEYLTQLLFVNVGRPVVPVIVVANISTEGQGGHNTQCILWCNDHLYSKLNIQHETHHPVFEYLKENNINAENIMLFKCFNGNCPGDGILIDSQFISCNSHSELCDKQISLILNSLVMSLNEVSNDKNYVIHDNNVIEEEIINEVIRMPKNDMEKDKIDSSERRRVFINKGYKYKKYSYKDGAIFYRCKNGKCSGRGVQVGTKFLVTKAHGDNCKPRRHFDNQLTTTLADTESVSVRFEGFPAKFALKGHTYLKLSAYVPPPSNSHPTVEDDSFNAWEKNTNRTATEDLALKAFYACVNNRGLTGCSGGRDCPGLGELNARYEFLLTLPHDPEVCSTSTKHPLGGLDEEPDQPCGDNWKTGLFDEKAEAMQRRSRLLPSSSLSSTIRTSSPPPPITMTAEENNLLKPIALPMDFKDANNDDDTLKRRDDEDVYKVTEDDKVSQLSDLSYASSTKGEEAGEEPSSSATKEIYATYPAAAGDDSNQTGLKNYQTIGIDFSQKPGSQYIQNNGFYYTRTTNEGFPYATGLETNIFLYECLDKYSPSANISNCPARAVFSIPPPAFDDDGGGITPSPPLPPPFETGDDGDFVLLQPHNHSPPSEPPSSIKVQMRPRGRGRPPGTVGSRLRPHFPNNDDLTTNIDEEYQAWFEASLSFTDDSEDEDFEIKRESEMEAEAEDFEYECQLPTDDEEEGTIFDEKKSDLSSSSLPSHDEDDNEFADLDSLQSWKRYRTTNGGTDKGGKKKHPFRRYRRFQEDRFPSSSRTITPPIPLDTTTNAIAINNNITRQLSNALPINTNDTAYLYNSIASISHPDFGWYQDNVVSNDNSNTIAAQNLEDIARIRDYFEKNEERYLNKHRPSQDQPLYYLQQQIPNSAAPLIVTTTTAIELYGTSVSTNNDNNNNNDLRIYNEENQLIHIEKSRTAVPTTKATADGIREKNPPSLAADVIVSGKRIRKRKQYSDCIMYYDNVPKASPVTQTSVTQTPVIQTLTTLAPVTQTPTLNQLALLTATTTETENFTTDADRKQQTHLNQVGRDFPSDVIVTTTAGAAATSVVAVSTFDERVLEESIEPIETTRSEISYLPGRKSGSPHSPFCDGYLYRVTNNTLGPLAFAVCRSIDCLGRGYLNKSINTFYLTQAHNHDRLTQTEAVNLLERQPFVVSSIKQRLASEFYSKQPKDKLLSSDPCTFNIPGLSYVISRLGNIIYNYKNYLYVISKYYKDTAFLRCRRSTCLVRARIHPIKGFKYTRTHNHGEDYHEYLGLVTRYRMKQAMIANPTKHPRQVYCEVINQIMLELEMQEQQASKCMDNQNPTNFSSSTAPSTIPPTTPIQTTTPTTNDVLANMIKSEVDYDESGNNLIISTATGTKGFSADTLLAPSDESPAQASSVVDVTKKYYKAFPSYKSLDRSMRRLIMCLEDEETNVIKNSNPATLIRKSVTLKTTPKSIIDGAASSSSRRRRNLYPHEGGTGGGAMKRNRFFMSPSAAAGNGGTGGAYLYPTESSFDAFGNHLVPSFLLKNEQQPMVMYAGESSGGLDGSSTLDLYGGGSQADTLNCFALVEGGMMTSHPPSSQPVTIVDPSTGITYTTTLDQLLLIQQQQLQHQQLLEQEQDEAAALQQQQQHQSMLLLQKEGELANSQLILASATAGTTTSSTLIDCSGVLEQNIDVIGGMNHTPIGSFSEETTKTTIDSATTYYYYDPVTGGLLSSSTTTDIIGNNPPSASTIATTADLSRDNNILGEKNSAEFLQLQTDDNNNQTIEFANRDQLIAYLQLTNSAFNLVVEEGGEGCEDTTITKKNIDMQPTIITDSMNVEEEQIVMADPDPTNLDDLTNLSDLALMNIKNLTGSGVLLNDSGSSMTYTLTQGENGEFVLNPIILGGGNEEIVVGDEATIASASAAISTSTQTITSDS